MDNSAYEAELKAVLDTDVKLGWPRALGLHLARVLANGLAGMDALYPDVYPLATSLLKQAVLMQGEIKIISTLRSFAVQNALYAQGRTTPGAVVTNAQGGQSYHNYGLAFDIDIVKLPPNVSPETFRAQLGAYWETIGGDWGGHFNDYGHFEYHPNFDWRDVIRYFTNNHA